MPKTQNVEHRISVLCNNCSVKPLMEAAKVPKQERLQTQRLIRSKSPLIWCMTEQCMLTTKLLCECRPTVNSNVTHHLSRQTHIFSHFGKH